MVNRKQLITENINLVYGVIHKYYPTFIHDEDLKQVGMIGLCKAAKIYDASKGKFSSVAFHCIINEIKHEFKRRMKHPKDILSLDYEVYGDDNSVTTFGEMLVGVDDIDCVDYNSICEHLSERECVVFKMAKEGASSKEIATMLSIHHETARKHLRKIKSIIKREVNDNVDEV